MSTHPRRLLLALLAAATSLAPACKKREEPTAPKTAPAPTARPIAFHEIGGIRAGDDIFIVDFYMEVAYHPGYTGRTDGSWLDLRGVKCPQPSEPGGPEALAFTQDFLTGSKVRIEANWHSKSDRSHGQLDVFRQTDGAFLNAELVRHGHARVTDTATPEHIEQLRALETEAKAAKLGIWK